MVPHAFGNTEKTTAGREQGFRRKGIRARETQLHFSLRASGGSCIHVESYALLYARSCHDLPAVGCSAVHIRAYRILCNLEKKSIADQPSKRQNQEISYSKRSFDNPNKGNWQSPLTFPLSPNMPAAVLRIVAPQHLKVQLLTCWKLIEHFSIPSTTYLTLLRYPRRSFQADKKSEDAIPS